MNAAVALISAIALTGAAPTPVTTAGVAPDVRAAAQWIVEQDPSVGLAEAIRRVDGGPARIKLIRELVTGHPDTFGGSWYDPLTGVQHLSATTAAARADLGAAADRAGVAAEVIPARFSYRSLRAEADLINEGRHPVLGAAGAGRAGVDARSNRAVVALPTSARVATPLPESISIVAAPATGGDDACTGKYSCGIPMRGGIALQYGGGTCSIGYTAWAGDGSRWVVSAGHCGEIDNGFWHGEQTIGLMRQKTEATIDMSRIRISNSYWLAGSFGWLYNTAAPNTPVALNDYADSLAELQSGEPVCLDAIHSTDGNICAAIVTTSGYRTFVPIDACRGDSGGAWYAPGGGVRTAFGTHEGSTEDGCHVEGGTSYFSPVPYIHQYFDNNSAARIRIDIRAG